MRPQNPAIADDDNNHQVLKSVYKTLRANISFGSAETYASDGSIATYSQDNTDGQLIRVAENANPLGLSSFWSGSNIDTTINHNLGRIPVGYTIVSKTKTCDVYTGTIVATEQTITLKNTDGTTDTVLYIF